MAATISASSAPSASTSRAHCGFMAGCDAAPSSKRCLGPPFVVLSPRTFRPRLFVVVRNVDFAVVAACMLCGSLDKLRDISKLLNEFKELSRSSLLVIRSLSAACHSLQGLPADLSIFRSNLSGFCSLFAVAPPRPPVCRAGPAPTCCTLSAIGCPLALSYQPSREWSAGSLSDGV